MDDMEAEAVAKTVVSSATGTIKLYYTTTTSNDYIVDTVDTVSMKWDGKHWRIEEDKPDPPKENELGPIHP